jgi:hypothetical protein
VIIAELGVEMSDFPSDHHLASWTGICPGNTESAGKHKSGKTRKGHRGFRITLSEAAGTAIRTRTVPCGFDTGASCGLDPVPWTPYPLYSVRTPGE